MQVRTYTVGPLSEHTYVVYNELKEAIVIDPGLAFKKTAYEINSIYNVKAVLLTHAHADHIDGIGFFDCPIYISKADVDGLTGIKSLYSEIGTTRSFDINKLNVITFSDEKSISLIGLDIKPIFTPGHTKGSVCYLIEDSLFSGDTLFKYAYGRTDFYSGSQDSMIKSIHKLLETLDKDIYVYPGHDQNTSIAFEQEHNMARK